MVVVETLDSGTTFYRINSCKSRRDLIYKFHRSTQECWIYVSKKSFARAKASSITRDFKNNLPKKNFSPYSKQKWSGVEDAQNPIDALGHNFKEIFAIDEAIRAIVCLEIHNSKYRFFWWNLIQPCEYCSTVAF